MEPGRKASLTDEFATWVFSLGNAFNIVPLGELISGERLLKLLAPLPQAQPQAVLERILNEDNHPPLYFVLAHLWYRLFPADNGYLNVAVGRSLPVIFGILSVPVGYGCVKWVWGKKQEAAAQWVAVMLAISPYGVFVAQEARHYTLAILAGLLSVACCLKSAQYWQQEKPLPRRLALGWVLANGFCLSVHFFLGLLILAQGCALLIWRWRLWQEQKIPVGRSIISFLPVLGGTLTVVGVWAWLITQREFGNNMTHWIQFNDIHFWGYFGPPFQILAAWITMFCLFPVEASQLWVALLSGLCMLLYFIWLVPLLRQGIRHSNHSPQGLETQLLRRMLGSLFFLYLAIAYGTGMDITRGARYSFTFLPVLMWLGGIALAASGGSQETEATVKKTDGTMGPTEERSWLKPLRLWLKKSRQPPGRLGIVLMVGILSGITITHNLGYQKYYRPYQFLSLLDATPTTEQRWIVTTHQSLVQTGEMLGLALGIERKFPQLAHQLQFLLIPQTELHSPSTTTVLWEKLQAQTEPVDLWLVNYLAATDLPMCQLDLAPQKPIYGYAYKHFSCPAPATAAATPSM